VLALRRGRQPWWWLKEQGRIAAGEERLAAAAAVWVLAPRTPSLTRVGIALAGTATRLHTLPPHQHTPLLSPPVHLRSQTEVATSLAASLDSLSCPYAQDDASGTALSNTERVFVQVCMAAHSSSRPPPTQLLDQEAYLSSRWRGG
jgi:hypothetical protein